MLVLVLVLVLVLTFLLLAPSHSKRPSLWEHVRRPYSYHELCQRHTRRLDDVPRLLEGCSDLQFLVWKSKTTEWLPRDKKGKRAKDVRAMFCESGPILRLASPSVPGLDATCPYVSPNTPRALLRHAVSESYGRRLVLGGLPDSAIGQPSGEIERSKARTLENNIARFRHLDI